MQTIILKVLYLDFHFVLILDFSEVAWLYLGSKFGKKKNAYISQETENLCLL